MKTRAVFLTLLPVVLSLSACNQQAFNISPTSQAIQSPGNFVIPPKVDIILVEDDTGSAYEMYPAVSQELPQFLNQLQSESWDYHFVTTPLTTFRSIRQVLASKYDSNWGSAWQPPYPGAQAGLPGTVNPSFFTQPGSYTDLLTVYDISNTQGAMEPGFQTMQSFITSGLGASGFLRSDALLAILVVGNGNDTSGVTMCTRGDGFVGPCDLIGQPDGSSTRSFNQYLSYFQGLKPNAAQIRFYAAVAAESVSNCIGGRSITGTRYESMAGYLGGTSYDICTTPVSQVFTSLEGQLQATKLAIQQNYLALGSAPNVSTIQVTRFPGGSGPGQAVPQDATNGWTYAGYVTNQNAVFYPYPSSPITGYAVQLHGTAILQGNDTANVTFDPAGAQNSHSN